uniref:Uncharacterized protein n=1 Tax=Leptobrachium leishanense TaxID=445787 RepID=A0A8C5QJ49_9ANUR
MRLPGGRGEPRGRRRAAPRASPAARQEAFCVKRHFNEDNGGPALKLFLSEDVVAARLQRLSLDNDHSYGSSGFPKTSAKPWADREDDGSTDGSIFDLDNEDHSVIVDPGEFCMSSSKVLTVCPLLEETLQDCRPGNILPEKLLRSLSSPCMDLVLWSPPTSQIQKLLRSLTGLLESSPEKSSPSNQSSWSGREQVDTMEL